MAKRYYYPEAEAARTKRIGTSIVTAAGSVLDMWQRVRDRTTASQLNKALVQTTRGFHEFLRERERDPDWSTYESRFEEYQQDRYAEISEGITSREAQRQFDMHWRQSQESARQATAAMADARSLDEGQQQLFANIEEVSREQPGMERNPEKYLAAGEANIDVLVANAIEGGLIQGAAARQISAQSKERLRYAYGQSIHRQAILVLAQHEMRTDRIKEIMARAAYSGGEAYDELVAADIESPQLRELLEAYSATGLSPQDHERLARDMHYQADVIGQRVATDRYEAQEEFEKGLFDLTSGDDWRAVAEDDYRMLNESPLDTNRRLFWRNLVAQRLDREGTLTAAQQRRLAVTDERVEYTIASNYWNRNITDQVIKDELARVHGVGLSSADFHKWMNRMDSRVEDVIPEARTHIDAIDELFNAWLSQPGTADQLRDRAASKTVALLSFDGYVQSLIAEGTPRNEMVSKMNRFFSEIIREAVQKSKLGQAVDLGLNALRPIRELVTGQQIDRIVPGGELGTHSYDVLKEASPDVAEQIAPLRGAFIHESYDNENIGPAGSVAYYMEDEQEVWIRHEGTDYWFRELDGRWQMGQTNEGGEVQWQDWNQKLRDSVFADYEQAVSDVTAQTRGGVESMSNTAAVLLREVRGEGFYLDSATPQEIVQRAQSMMDVPDDRIDEAIAELGVLRTEIERRSGLRQMSIEAKKEDPNYAAIQNAINALDRRRRPPE